MIENKLFAKLVVSAFTSQTLNVQTYGEMAHKNQYKQQKCLFKIAIFGMPGQSSDYSCQYQTNLHL